MSAALTTDGRRKETKNNNNNSLTPPSSKGLKISPRVFPEIHFVFLGTPYKILKSLLNERLMDVDVNKERTKIHSH